MGRLLAAILVLISVAPVWAQTPGVLQSQIVTVDSERVFGDTSLGQGITTSLENQVTFLAAENRRIAAELEAEELSLTKQREFMEPSDFRILAENFDLKVRRIRSQQDAKQRELQILRDSERQEFIDTIGPILSRIARRHGAVVVLERRNVLLSADSIDITDQVINAINASRRAEQASPVASDGASDDASQTKESGASDGE